MIQVLEMPAAQARELFTVFLKGALDQPEPRKAIGFVFAKSFWHVRNIYVPIFRRALGQQLRFFGPTIRVTAGDIVIQFGTPRSQDHFEGELADAGWIDVDLTEKIYQNFAARIRRPGLDTQLLVCSQEFRRG